VRRRALVVAAFATAAAAAVGLGRRRHGAAPTPVEPAVPAREAHLPRVIAASPVTHGDEVTGEIAAGSPGRLGNAVSDIRAAGVAALGHDVPLIASAVAYSAFFAIPAVMLVALGTFTLVAGPSVIDGIVELLANVAPPPAIELIRGSMGRLDAEPATSVLITVLGLVLAVWTCTGAMGTLAGAIHTARGGRDDRSFIARRRSALMLVLTVGIVVVAVSVLLILGPHLQTWLGRALGAEHAVALVWWIAQWPIVVAALSAAFSLLYAIASRDGRPFRAHVVPALVATALWVAASLGFAAYAASFGSYEKTWGALTGVIVTLTWLWLSAAIILVGAELDAVRARKDTTRYGDGQRRAASGEHSPEPAAGM
jgi:membrane protein